LKGLLFPAIAALALHALLLSVKMDRLKEKLPPRPGPVCLSLSYRTPDARQVPSPKAVDETQKTPEPPEPRDPPDPNPEEPKRNPVSERKSLSPKKALPLAVPRERAVPEIRQPSVKIESQAVREGPPQAETEPEISPSPASATKGASSSTDSPSLVETPNPDEEKVYSKQAAPLYLKNPPPDYPSMARRRGSEGTVILEVLVDREGRVRDLNVFQSSGHKMLDRAAMRAVKGWLFEPGTRGEEKTDMWVKVPVTFRLN
jgi:periplasmic protein TonB